MGCAAEEGLPNGSGRYLRNVVTYLPKGILFQEAIFTTIRISSLHVVTRIMSVEKLACEVRP
jgi:hypothetical protein